MACWYFSEYIKGDRLCICHHILERMKHRGHIFHIEKLCEFILTGKCPHVKTNSEVSYIATCGISFMSAASALCKEDVVRYLMVRGCSVNTMTSALHLAPIHFAAMTPNQNLLHFLLSNKADVNSVCRFEDGVYSPLMLAARSGDVGIVQLLLSNSSVRKDFQNQNNIGSLTCALENTNLEVLDILIKAGVKATKTTIIQANEMKDSRLMGKVLSTRPLEFFHERLQNYLIESAVKSGAYYYDIHVECIGFFPVKSPHLH